MASTIAPGGIANVQVADAQTSVSPLLNAYDVNSAVAAYLNGLGYRVRQTSVSGAITSTIVPLIQETYQSTLLVECPNGSDTDLLTNDVSSAFVEVTGKTSSQITIPTITTSDGTINTGLPSANQGVGATFTDAIANFFKGLKTLGTTLLIGLAAIVVLVLVLLAYSPTGQTLAGRA